MHHDDPSTRQHTRHIALDDVVAAAELTERDAHVALQSQQVRQTIDGGQGRGVDKYDGRRVVRRQS